jgi:hypothetical protein
VHFAENNTSNTTIVAHKAAFKKTPPVFRGYLKKA